MGNNPYGAPMGPGMLPTMPGQQPQAPAAPQAPSVQNPYGLDPQVLEAMLGTYGDQLEIGALEKQMEQANALRQATPEGRQAGRVYVAANPLEHLGKGIGDYKLMKQRKANEAAQAEARKRIGENVRTYGKNIPGA
jgi:hypothetical protein